MEFLRLASAVHFCCHIRLMDLLRIATCEPAEDNLLVVLYRNIRSIFGHLRTSAKLLKTVAKSDQQLATCKLVTSS